MKDYPVPESNGKKQHIKIFRRFASAYGYSMIKKGDGYLCIHNGNKNITFFLEGSAADKKSLFQGIQHNLQQCARKLARSEEDLCRARKECENAEALVDLGKIVRPELLGGNRLLLM